MTKIQATGLHPEMLRTFFLSRYWKEASVVERMSAGPGASSPFDRIPKAVKAQIMALIEELREQGIQDNAVLLAEFDRACRE
jgi:hypothetical protein